MDFIKKYKNVLAGLLINIVERHSVVLYGYYASLMAPIFFPSDDPKLNEMRALGVFALTFVMQPLAGFVLGRIGDQYGRKASMIIGVLLIALPTILIGLLPGYETLGVIAPILLILALIMQSAGSVAAYNGTAVFLNEFAGSKMKSFFSGLLVSSSFAGAVIASFCGAISSSPTGWRMPFITGGILGLCILGLRKHLEETPVFQKSLKTHKNNGEKPESFLKIAKKRKRNLLCTIGIAAGCNLPFFTISIFFNSFFTLDLGISHSSMLAYNMVVLIFWAVTLPFMGHVADKIGTRRLMLFSSLALAALSVPLFSWAMVAPNLTNITILRLILSIFSISILAPATSYVAQLFVVRERQTSLGTGDAIGTVLFGGTAPLICRFLIDQTGSTVAPAYYLSLCALICAFSIWYAKPLEEEE
jgi:MHS family proline/betaine transporter-like MFS transporter